MTGLVCIATIIGGPFVWLWWVSRHGPVDPEWADPFITHWDDLRCDFDWPDGYPKVGDAMAGPQAALLAVELFADIEREVGIA